MKSIYSSTRLVVALAAPFTVLSQHHEGGHDLEKRQDWTKDVNWATVNYGNVAAPVATPTTTSVLVANKMVVAPPSSSPPGAVAPSSPSSSSSSGGTPTTSTTCSGTGMMIEWTSDSDSVPFSWSGGSGTTSPGSCTDLGAFNGQLAVNGKGGTIFEGNYNGGDMYFDVSFIIGYSAPMICSSSTSISGCNLDLHAEAAIGGYECPHQGDESHICTNPVGSNGTLTPGAYQGKMGDSPWCRACSPPHAFFLPCAGAGYTYPYDDTAAQHGTGTLQCCIGTKCAKTGREGKSTEGYPQPTRVPPCTPCTGGSKRGLEDVFDQYEKDARPLTPLVPRRKRSAHKHAHAHGAQGV